MALSVPLLLGWTAPDGIEMCQNELLLISDKEDRL